MHNYKAVIQSSRQGGVVDNLDHFLLFLDKNIHCESSSESAFDDTLLMSGHNMTFSEEKYGKLSMLPLLIWSTAVISVCKGTILGLQ